MIRILFTIPNFNTAGSGKALLNLASQLDKHIFEVHIACKTDTGAFFKTVQASGIPVHVFDYEPPMRPLMKLFRQGWAISRQLKKIEPDLIHSFHYNNNYGEALAARMAGCKWVFTKKNMNWGSDGANAWKIRSRLAAHIVIQNREMKTQFYPTSRKTTLIERGIEIEKFAPGACFTHVKEQMNTPVDGRVIIAVANMFPVKGIAVLVDAFAQLMPNYPDWHLWLVGDDSTSYGMEVHESVSRQQLGNQIHFAGKQNNVVPFLDCAELFVLPTLATGEGSPVALIEAMVNGKVVLGSKVPGIQDQLAHVPQHLFPAGDADALAAALRQLMNNDRKANEILGASFRKYARTKYSIEREVRDHEAVYKNLVNG